MTTSSELRVDRRLGKALAAALFAAVAPLESVAEGVGPKPPFKVDYHLRSTPANTVWGGFPIDVPAALTITSGKTVRIDGLSQTGVTNASFSPTTFYGALGVAPEEILPDATPSAP
jgi:hypothetical protein